MEIGFEIILPTHAEIIRPWVNDPETLRQSFNKTPRDKETFYEEFLARYFTSERFPSLFILADGARAGYLRFKEREALEISICIAPSMRGKGVATKALKEVQNLLKTKVLMAEVLEGNQASEKAFLAAGFTKGPRVKGVYTFTKGKKEKKGVFIIAEAGSNWRLGSPKQDMAMAKELIYVAKESGSDAVKFQTYRPETIYVPNAGEAGYLKKDINAIFEDLAMPYEMLKELAEYAKSLEIEFMSTPFSEKDFKEVDPYVKRHKIASYESGHPHLIRLAAESKKPVFMSTGATTVDEIAWAVSYFRKQGGKDLTLLQCTAKYPAESADMNLSAITYLKERFRLPVGLSDHSRDPLTAPVMATALGASVIEKHFTLSNQLPGPDNSFAVLPHELKEMVRHVRIASEMRGSGYKEILPVEEELRMFCKRGLQAIRVIEKGETFKEGVNFAILRPGNQTQGAEPRFYADIEGKTAKRRIDLGSGILPGDW